ncbi:MAG: Holliday junction branch migration protein RuvA [Succinatimonas sp.]|jgi:Holliday junction DNA helicase RuvA|nr:Holliday junction branch migration protein RuvA [Succinatimonas sp.]MDD5868361.1 Holliday junction branch migration protein RuvA [Succinatimonas sp.]MDY5721045.1 Holliday junction branch migration protein RuvA [Succinivibrio sp.]
MIGSLSGRVLRIDGVTALIECGGVGYEVDMPVTSLSKLKVNENAFVYVQHIVREDAQILYGFNTVTERELFRTLIKVNGVGPKMALAVLSTFDVESFVETVLQEQSKALEQIPGVGKKTAQRMVVELKDNLKNFAVSTQISANPQATSTASSNESFNDAIAAMTALGYKEFDAVRYVKAVIAKEGNLSTQDLIVKALALISNKGRS